MEDPFAVGFTGSRAGLTDFQQKRLLELMLHLVKNGATEFHHGDCEGADAESHEIAIRAGFEHIVIHPPTDTKAQANCSACPSKGITYRERQPYLTRNHAIVNETSVMIACPKGPEVVRSGTWATIRHTRKHGAVLYLLYPTYIEKENDPFNWDPEERYTPMVRKELRS